MYQEITTTKKHYLIKGDILRHGDNQYIVVNVKSDTAMTVRPPSWFARLRIKFFRWLLPHVKRLADVW